MAIELSERGKEFLKENKQLLMKNDFDKLIPKAMSTLRIRKLINNLIDFLYLEADIEIFSLMKTIPDNMIWADENITSIDIKNCESIGGNFAKDSSLEEVNIFDGVKDIGSSAFASCPKLTKVTLPNTLKTIPEKCFFGCSGLKEIFIPDSVTYIRSSAFDGCDDIVIYANYRDDDTNKIRIKSQDIPFFKQHLKFKHKKPQQDVQQEQLNEAFSSSMPKWLRERILYLKSKRGTSSSNHLDRYTKKGYNFTGQIHPDFGKNAFRDMDRELMDTYAVDVSSANFIEEPVPTKASDPAFKSPNIPFFHLVIPGYGQTVYAKGINDDERFPGGDLFKYTSMKKLIEYTKDFCYLDLANAPKVDKKVADRKANKEDPYMKRYKRGDDYPGRYYRGTSLDKSGYLIDPDHLKKKLRDIHRDDVSAYLKKFYKKIMKIKKDLAIAVEDVDIADPQDLTQMIDNGPFSDLKNIIRNYNDIAKLVTQAISTSDKQECDFYLDELFGRGRRSFKELDEQVKDLESSCKKYVNAIIDWDTPEEESLQKHCISNKRCSLQ